MKILDDKLELLLNDNGEMFIRRVNKPLEGQKRIQWYSYLDAFYEVLEQEYILQLEQKYHLNK